jgi:anaerobic selenocysteine-containing dehydrogenase
MSDPTVSVITGACPHDCPDTCAWQVAVNIQENRAIDIWGHPDHPITQGRLCNKVDRYLERTYHDGRLTTPLRRVGPKGSGQYEAVSWQAAIADIGTQLTAVADEYGPQSILPYSYCGTMGLLQREGMASRFFNRLGASRLARTICSEAGFEGYAYTIGAAEGMAAEAYAHARLILIWGSNTLTSNVHLWPFIQQARKSGARVIVIDPARTRTARAADEWIAIRPGTDGALAMAMMNVIIGKNLQDSAYIKRYTLGFEALAARVASWTPQRAAAITGIRAQRIQALAVAYAGTKPAAIRVHPRPVDPTPSPEEAGAPVKALIVYNSNPAAVTPDQQAVLQGLAREDLFTVVLEQFQTDTADYADYILPATTQLEHWDLLKPYGHLYLHLNRPAIPPVGDSLPNSEIFRRLAAAMGFDDPCFQEDDETILRTLVEAQSHKQFASITWQKLLDQGYARIDVPDPHIPFAKGKFPTPSGKCEFYSERMARDGYDPLPDFAPPAWIEADSQAQAVAVESETNGDRLVCISPPAHSYLNSSFANLERFRQREKQPLLIIHPQDAEQRAIGQGDSIQVWNELGSVRLTAELSEEIIAGSVLAPGIWWSKLSPDGRNINQVTPQDEADMGAGAIFYDVQVMVARVDADADQPMANVVSTAAAD